MNGSVLVAVGTGIAGGVAASLGLKTPIAVGALLGATYGLGFGLLFRSRELTPGSGLIWGLGYAFLLWLLVPAGVVPLLAERFAAAGVLETCRSHFPDLVAYVVCYGAPLGVLTGAVNGQPRFRISRALFGGGFAGVIGGWAFGKWMEQVNFFPLLAGIVDSDSAMVGAGLHFAFSIVVGASFGVLFQRDIRGLGSSMGWGMAYGMFWWFLGRPTHFRRDTGLSLPSASDSDYRHSGFHRGHLAPARDFAWDRQAMRATFLLSNAVPQYPAANNLSAQLESAIRRLAAQSEAIYVFTGSIFNSADPQRIGANRVAVPSHTFKVVLALQNGSLSMCAAIVPNSPAIREPLASFMTTVAEVERRTALDFFASLADDLEADLQSRLQPCLAQ